MEREWELEKRERRRWEGRENMMADEGRWLVEGRGGSWWWLPEKEVIGRGEKAGGRDDRRQRSVQPSTAGHTAAVRER